MDYTFELYDSAGKFSISSTCTPAHGGILKSDSRHSHPFWCRGQATPLTVDRDGAKLGLVQLGRFPADSVTRRLDCLHRMLQWTNALSHVYIEHMHSAGEQ